MSSFRLQLTQIRPDKRAPVSVDEFTRAALRVLLGSTNLTEFKSAEGGFHDQTFDHVEIPAYYLAEWIAENWWALLNEPLKSEEDEEEANRETADYALRHSFVTAQQGFALPAVRIVPNGRAIQVSSYGRIAPFADVRFTKSASLSLPPSEVEGALRGLVSHTVAMLDNAGIEDTDLQIAWNAIEETNDEEAAYCRMIGALGLSPYANNEWVDRWLFEVADKAGEDFAYDLSLVARPETLEDLAKSALKSMAVTSDAAPADISPLTAVQMPKDTLTTPAWQRGVKAAQLVRKSFGIAEDDPQSGAKFFDVIGLQIESGGAVSEIEMAHEARAPIVGALTRVDDTVKVGLLQRAKTQRRFAAARGVFVGWSSSARCARLLTKAVTRDQQSSRAFAAEILAPVGFLRRQADRHKKLQRDQVFDLAQELGVAPDVVWKQAMNNGMNPTVY